MTNTKLILPEEVSEKWHIYQEYLKAALKHGYQETHLVDYLNRLLNYQAQLWEFSVHNNVVGVGLTQFINYARYKTLHLTLCSGVSWSDWADQYYVIEQFAKENSCKAVETWGRKGWARQLPRYLPGFEESYVVMRKEL